MTAKSKLDDWLSEIDFDAPEEIGADELERAYLEAAAVLTSFDPHTLNPAAWPGRPERSAYSYLESALSAATDAPSQTVPVKDSDPWTLCLKDAIEPVALDQERMLLTLSTARRRTVLEHLGTREAMAAALEANPERTTDVVQRAFETIVAGKKFKVSSLTRDEISGLIRASEWVDGVLDDIPDRHKLAENLERAELTHAFRKLVGEHFAGRKNALRQLRDHVGFIEADSVVSAASRFVASLEYSLVDRPPLVIHGPGGIGKSTLVAKFLLDHFESAKEQRFPFAYLNFDRPRLRAEQPLTLLMDAAWQLGIQFRDDQPLFNDFIRSAGEYLTRLDNAESSKNVSFDWQEYLLPEFVRLLNEAAPGDAPFVLILDTFEEVQFLGEDHVGLTWEFLEKLQSALPRLRSVIAGRAPIQKRWMKEELELRDFEPDSARGFLENVFAEMNVEPDDDLINKVVETVGGNPLSLRLAARLVQQEGAEGLKSVKTRRLLLLKMKSEQVQALLHGRILKHLHDKDLAKIAYPGLLVRRITPEVITEILAGPCNLKLDGAADAVALFDKLRREVALVESARDDPEPRVLRHRENVRRVMLDDLARVQPKVAGAIHRKAIKYYKDRPGTIARAEEIYHRLRLGQSAEKIDERWLPGMEVYLRPALEELAPRERMLLATRLGVTPDAQLRKDASQEEWERSTLRRVKTYMQAGDPARALKILNERNDPFLPGSELYVYKVSALRSVGQLEKARTAALDGLENFSKSAANSLTGKVLMLLALIDEEEGDFESALTYVEQAKDFATSIGEPIDALRADVARLRLLRKQGLDQDNPLRKKGIEALARDAGKHRRQLPKYPALFREIIAEAGAADPELLKQGVARLGVEIAREEQAQVLGNSLRDWDNEIKADQETSKPGGTASSPLGNLVKMDSKDAGSQRAWAEWVTRNMGSRLTRQLARLMDTYQTTTQFQNSLIGLYRASVESSIHGLEGGSPSRGRTTRGK